MEHILQFAVSIDEDAIAKTAIERASERILKKANNDIDNYIHRYPSELREIMANRIDIIVKEREDEIIEQAIKRVADNLCKRKKVKEALDKLSDEVFSHDNN